MNPVDHPHGGGEGRCPIGKPRPLTPWGKPALGIKTRKRKNKSDIFIEKNGIKIYNGIDPKILDGKTYLLSGSYDDSFLCEIYYYDENSYSIMSII